MADLILHKRSETAAAVPSAGQLELGELAINVADGRLYFKKSSGEVVAVANLADIWAMQPIGKPFGLWTHLAGVAVPPTDNPNYRYIKLTASDSYNDGVLTSESISGSAPAVQATAVIDDSDSPLDGQPVRLINTEQRTLRAGSSGTVQADQVGPLLYAQSTYTSTTNVFVANVASVGAVMPRLLGTTQTTPVAAATDGTRWVTNTGSETRVKSIGIDVYMRIR